MTSVKHTLTLGLAPADLRALAAARARAPRGSLKAASLLRLQRQQLITDGWPRSDHRPVLTAAGLFALAPAQQLFRLREVLRPAQELARRTARAFALAPSVCLARVLSGQRYCAACSDWHRKGLVVQGLCAEGKACYTTGVVLGQEGDRG